MNYLLLLNITDNIWCFITGYGLKFFLAAALTPALYLLKSVLQDQFGMVPLPVEEEK